MEGRRTTRTAPPAEPPAAAATKPTRRLATRQSPARGVSPPTVAATRRQSPGRKSPSRAAATKTAPPPPQPKKNTPSPLPKRRGRPLKPASESGKKSPRLAISIAQLSPEVLRSATNRSVATSKSTVTTSSTRVKVSNVADDVSEDEVARLTADYVEKARAKLLRQTPTPSDFSRRSASRSVHSLSRSILDDDERRTDEEYSDNEHEPVYESFTLDDKYSSAATEAKTKETLSEFGGSIGALFWIVLLFVLGFALPFVCTRQDCTGTWASLSKLRNPATYINLEAAYLFFGFSWAMFLLSAVPLGRRVRIATDRGPVEYTFNGIVSGLLAVAALGLAEYMKYPVMKMLYKNYQQLAFLSLAYALVLAAWCFLRSRWQPAHTWNSYANSGRILADYFIGRETNPRWFGLIDIKLAHFRIAVVAALLFNVIFAYKTLKFAALPVGADGNVTMTVQEVLQFATANVKYDSVTLFLAVLMCFYLGDLLLNEHHLTSSFELQGEGVGAMLLLQYAMFPFSMSLITKWAFDHKVSSSVPLWALIMVTVLFVLGVLIKRRANKLKYEYRLYPGLNKFSGNEQFFFSHTTANIFLFFPAF